MSTRQLITRNDFKGLCARNELSQAQSGTRTLLNAYLEEKIETIVKTSMLQADHEGKATLTGRHARIALDATPGIPKGLY